MISLGTPNGHDRTFLRKKKKQTLPNYFSILTYNELTAKTCKRFWLNLYIWHVKQIWSTMRDLHIAKQTL